MIQISDPCLRRGSKERKGRSFGRVSSKPKCYRQDAGCTLEVDDGRLKGEIAQFEV